MDFKDMNATLKSYQADFIEDELWILAWNGSVQRANVYKKGAEDADKAAFRTLLVWHIKDKIIPNYRQAVTEESHLKYIRSLISEANKNGTKVLGTNYKYGVAQKLLNLTLKYYWCRDLVAEPPHCPVDRIILERTKLKDKINWTEIDQESTYLEAIVAIRTEADKVEKSLAVYELEEFGRRKNSV